MSIQNVYPELSSAQFSTGGAPMQVTVVGPYPIQIKCPSCHTDVKTKAIYEAGTKTHIFAALLCLFGCWCCCCCPYCIESCQNLQHSCPNCGAYIGTYKP